MVQSPYRFEEQWSEADLAAIGRLALRWALNEHILKNCLRVRLGLSLEEANTEIYPLSLETVLQRIEWLHKIKPPRKKAAEIFSELKPIIRALQVVRNDAVHSVLKETENGHIFENRAKGRSATKAEVLSCEELTRYSGTLVIAFRYALGFKDGPKPPRKLPTRPEIPNFLKSKIQLPKV
jgi:hypothetical protein